jgi:hypothetical protein
VGEEVRRMELAVVALFLVTTSDGGSNGLHDHDFTTTETAHLDQSSRLGSRAFELATHGIGKIPD